MPTDETRYARGTFAGPSILETLWEELDAITDRLYSKQGAEDDRGKAQGVAYCIAVMTNPYSPDMPGVKRTAVRRWHSNNPKEIHSP